MKTTCVLLAFLAICAASVQAKYFTKLSGLDWSALSKKEAEDVLTKQATETLTTAYEEYMGKVKDSIKAYVDSLPKMGSYKYGRKLHTFKKDVPKIEWPEFEWPKFEWPNKTWTIEYPEMKPVEYPKFNYTLPKLDMDYKKVEYEMPKWKYTMPKEYKKVDYEMPKWEMPKWNDAKPEYKKVEYELPEWNYTMYNYTDSKLIKDYGEEKDGY